MPQLDLDNQDHLVCVGARGHGESKCDTAAASDDAVAVQHGGDVSATARAGDDGDAPAESVLLRVRSGICLAELLGAALRRDGSTKGSSNPKAAAEAAATRKQGAPRADSRRLPAAAASKTAAVVIGVLPAAGKVVANKERRARVAAPGRAVAVARAWRRPAAGARVFASEAVGTEPVSPKVSCFGAVLPEARAAAAPGPASGKREEKEERGGCWASAAAALRGLCCSCDSDHEGETGAGLSDSKAAAAEPPPAAAVMSPPQPVAGLGEVKRLASRRWPETMAAEGRGSV